MLGGCVSCCLHHHFQSGPELKIIAKPTRLIISSPVSFLYQDGVSGVVSVRRLQSAHSPTNKSPLFSFPLSSREEIFIIPDPTLPGVVIFLIITVSLSVLSDASPRWPVSQQTSNFGLHHQNIVLGHCSPATRQSLIDQPDY